MLIQQGYLKAAEKALAQQACFINCYGLVHFVLNPSKHLSWILFGKNKFSLVNDCQFLTSTVRVAVLLPSIVASSSILILRRSTGFRILSLLTKILFAFLSIFHLLNSLTKNREFLSRPEISPTENFSQLKTSGVGRTCPQAGIKLNQQSLAISHKAPFKQP